MRDTSLAEGAAAAAEPLNANRPPPPEPPAMAPAQVRLPAFAGTDEVRGALHCINQELNRTRIPEDLVETAIEQLWSRAEAGDPDGTSPEFWLLIARLAEATLLCAGRYADQAEFQPAGDLLFNPRLVIVSLKGRKDPLYKSRHAGLSAQLRAKGQSQASFTGWFRQNAELDIARRPLLTELSERMMSSGRLCPDYLTTIRSRMGRVADTLVFLSSWGVRGFEDFHTRLLSLNKSEKNWIESNLCRFSRRRFDRLGVDIAHNAATSTFLVQPDAVQRAWPEAPHNLKHQANTKGGCRYD